LRTVIKNLVISDLLRKHGGKTYLELQEEELADLLRKNSAK
jgi:hypothetical protein